MHNLSELIKKSLLLLKSGENFTYSGMDRAFTSDEIRDELNDELKASTKDANKAIKVMKEQGLIESVVRSSVDENEKITGLCGKGFVLTGLGRINLSLTK